MPIAKDFSRKITFDSLRDSFSWSSWEWEPHLTLGALRHDMLSDSIEGPGDELFTFSSARNGITEIASFDGGAGNDTLDATFGFVGPATGGLTTDFTDNGDGTFSAIYSRDDSDGADNVSIVNIENVFISVFGDGNGLGNEDFVRTGDGNDQIFTDNGADTIVAGKGVDTVDGGTSDEFGERDTISKDFSDVLVDIDWNIQTGAFSGPGSFTGVEVFGTLQTGGGDDTIVTDTFSGSSGLGDSFFSTGAGDDLITLFNGTDVVDLGSGTDRLILDYSDASFTGNTEMTLAQTVFGTYSGSWSSSHSSGPQVTFEGVEHFTILTLDSGGNGSNLVDRIITGNGDDIIFSGASADYIDAGRGIDTVDGGETGVDIDGLAKEFTPAAPAININLLANTYSGPGFYTNLEWFIDLRTGNGDDIVVTTGADADERGDDLIFTRGGDDTVTLFDGTDTVDMGAGSDRLILDYGSSENTSFLGDTVMTLTGNFADGYSGTWDSAHSSAPDASFTGIEHFTIRTLSSGGNGSNLTDFIVTGDGNDDIFSGASHDDIYVGGGEDTVDGGDTGTDIDGLSKEFGADAPKVVFDLFTNTFFGPGSYTNLEYFIELRTGAGNDVIDTTSDSSSGRGDDLIYTRGGNDRVTVRDALDTVHMGGGNDTLIVDYATINTFTANTTFSITETSPGTYSGELATGYSHKGVTFTGVENFWLYMAVSGGNGFNLKDDITTGDGNDRIYTGPSSDTVFSGGGNDIVDGGVSNDLLDGGAGDDTLIGGTGRDTLTGGTGADVFRYLAAEESPASSNADLITDFETGIDTLDLAAIGSQDLTLTEVGDETLVEGTSDGVAYRIRVQGEIALGDIVTGLLLKGDNGVNILEGGHGDDSLLGFGGDDLLIGGSGKDILLGGSDNDVLVGDSQNDRLDGGEGNDSLQGGGDDDTLIGGIGEDELAGDAGNDKLLGDAGKDQLEGGDGDDILRGGDDNDVLRGGDGQDVLLGENGRDVLIGNGGDDRLDGGEGNDVLNGGGGDDRLVGRAGDDVLYGVNGRDKLFGGGGNDILLGGGDNDVLFGNSGNDVLVGGGQADRLDGGEGNDDLSGGGDNDRLSGGEGDDTLSGGGGRDKIFGDEGDDTMSGDGGNDLFIFRGDSGLDTITDFEDGADLIHLFDYREENGGQALTFDQLLITQNGNDTGIELDLDRDGVADAIDLDGDGNGDAWHIDLLDTNAATITAADFVF